MLTRSAGTDHAELCSLDVLGLKEDASKMDNDIYKRFMDQLGRNEKGWYETNIMWKQFSPALPSWTTRKSPEKDEKRSEAAAII